MEKIFIILSGYLIFKIILFIGILTITLAPLFIWMHTRKSSQIQLDTLLAIENQNKILLELMKVATKNDSYNIELTERIRRYNK